MSRNCHRSAAITAPGAGAVPVGTASPLGQPWGRQGRAGTALGPSQTAPGLSSAALGHSHGMGWAGRDLRVKCDFSSQFLMLMPPLWNNRSQNDLSEPCPSFIPAGILWVRSGGNFQGCALPEMFHSQPFPLPQYKVIPKQISPRSL